MQLFIRGLNGSTAVVEIPSNAVAAQLKSAIQERCGVPAAAQILLCSSRALHDTQSLCSQGVSRESTIYVTSRLLGGKGGFGALLRGQKRDGKITNNYDACRDLSGRRIRYQTAEEKLQKWHAEAKERELEQLAMKHLKEQAKKERREQQSQVDVEAVREEQQKAVEQVQDAVQAALASASNGSGSSGKGSAGPAKAGAKHRLDTAAPGPSKKPKMLAMLETGFSDSDDDEDDGDDSNSSSDSDADVAADSAVDAAQDSADTAGAETDKQD